MTRTRRNCRTAREGTEKSVAKRKPASQRRRRMKRRMRNTLKKISIVFLLSRLEYHGDKALCTAHVFNIGLPDGLNKRLLLNMYPVQMTDEDTCEQDRQAGPVCHSETYTQHGQERTTVSGMAKSAIWSVLHDLLTNGDGDITGKVAPQRPDSVPAQGHAEKDESYAQRKECCALPAHRGCREQRSEREIQSEAAPLQADQDTHRTAILDGCLFSRYSGSLPDCTSHFRNNPYQAGGQKESRRFCIGVDQWQQILLLLRNMRHLTEKMAETRAETGLTGEAFRGRIPA